MPDSEISLMMMKFDYKKQGLQDCGLSLKQKYSEDSF